MINSLSTCSFFSCDVHLQFQWFIHCSQMMFPVIYFSYAIVLMITTSTIFNTWFIPNDSLVFFTFPTDSFICTSDSIIVDMKFFQWFIYFFRYFFLFRYDSFIFTWWHFFFFTIHPFSNVHFSPVVRLLFTILFPFFFFDSFVFTWSHALHIFPRAVEFSSFSCAHSYVWNARNSFPTLTTFLYGFCKPATMTTLPPRRFWLRFLIPVTSDTESLSQILPYKSKYLWWFNHKGSALFLNHKRAVISHRTVLGAFCTCALRQKNKERQKNVEVGWRSLFVSFLKYEQT